MERDGPDDAGLPRFARALAPDLFYGWWVALGACLISFTCAGVAFYGQGVLLDALCHLRGWPRAAVAGATSAYFIVTGVVGLAIGRSIDRLGARPFIAAGALVLAASLVGVGRVESEGMLYVWFPVMALGGALAGAVPTALIVTRWFVAQRSRAMAVSQTGVSLSGIAVVPLATWLIRTRGLEFATEMLALLVVAIALPVAALVLRSDPARHGEVADGHAHAAALAAAGAPPVPREPVFRTRDALRTQAFWVLALAFGIGLFAQVGFLAHQLASLREKLEPAAAAFTVSATALGSVIGRILISPIMDRVEKRHVAMALFLVQAVATFAFARASGGAALASAAFVFGLTMGNIFMLQPLLVGEYFGVAAFASVLGALQLATQLACGLGPFAVGLAFERAGGYQRPLEALSVLAIAAALVLARVRAPAAKATGQGLGP